MDHRVPFSDSHRGLSVWLEDDGMHFEIENSFSRESNLAFEFVKAGEFRGASVALDYSVSRRVYVAGEPFEEIHRVSDVYDVTICRACANSFTGCCLIDESRKPRAVIPMNRAMGRKTTTAAAEVAAARRWHRDFRNSAKEQMEKALLEKTRERLGYAAGNSRIR